MPNCHRASVTAPIRDPFARESPGFYVVMINRCHPNRHRYRRRVEFPGDWPLQAQLAPDALERLDAILEANPELAAKAHEDPLLTRGVVVAARASRAITSFLMDHPIPSLSGPPTPEPDGADLNAVRRFVEGRLVRTAVRDLLGMADMPTVGRELADTADAAAAAALAIAMTTNPGPDIPFTVIAMGKWGAQELNYASDIDVLFVYDTPDGTDPDTARRHANHLAAGFIAALADVTTEGIAYRVDADLRPEGRNGPLARSITPTPPTTNAGHTPGSTSRSSKRDQLQETPPSAPPSPPSSPPTSTPTPSHPTPSETSAP